MIRLEEEMVTKALGLSPIDQLATNCPPCFGPVVPGKRAQEPDYIICLDGNFQHRRHMAASASWRGESGVLPAMFISPDLVKSWASRLGLHNNTRTKAEVIVRTWDWSISTIYVDFNCGLRTHVAASTQRPMMYEAGKLGRVLTRQVLWVWHAAMTIFSS